MQSSYIILCENSKYYVGNQETCEWTEKYKPIKILEIINKKDEDEYTKYYMKNYGIDNVRGGKYNTMELPTREIMKLQNELFTNGDVCLKCNQLGHSKDECNQKDNEGYITNGLDYIWYCDKCNSEFATEMEISIHIKKCISNDFIWRCEHCNREYYTENDVSIHQEKCKIYHMLNKCYRCNQIGHYAEKCHNEIRLYNCKYCTKEFSILKNLIAHEKLCKK
jgi:hypothetical protein